MSDLEAAAKLCEMTASEIKLLAGEMTAGELRTVRAVLSSRARAIRALAVATNVAYMPCAKHQGMSWTATITCATVGRTVCPICEPPVFPSGGHNTR